MREVPKPMHQTDPSVAIIGIGCFFAKSPNLKGYWRLLYHGKDAITTPPLTHDNLNDYFDKDPKKPDHIHCNRGGFLSPVPFDPTAFSIPPSNLEATDSSQILGLLAAKEALRDAGYGNGKSFNRDKTSVIIGVTGTQELSIPLGSRLGHPKWRRAILDSGVDEKTTNDIIQKISDSYVPWQENSFPGLLGNVVAGRIANRLNLGGTNCVVDAACASSMGAIRLGLLELHTGHSDMVITGGVDTINDIFMHMCFAKTMILSPSGDVRPFSEKADGTVLGEGIGLVVLKRLEDAVAANDRIYAVIKGMGSSSDGKSQSIYAPRADGQKKALMRAYENAGISPSTVDLVEAHGTGTRVGDLTEFTALRSVYESSNHRKTKCAIGSVKSNIGHTKAAAGTAGLIKTALSLYHKVIPPTIKADPADEKLEMDQSVFYLSTKARPWFKSNGDLRRSGVSAFGFGGSNYHTVLEEYQPAKKNPSWDGSVEIIALSDAHKDGILSQLDEMGKALKKAPSENHISKIYTDARKKFSHKDSNRCLIVVDKTDFKTDIADQIINAKTILQSNISRDAFEQGPVYFSSGVQQTSIGFLFPGQGSQYVNMGKDLICIFPEAFESVEIASKAMENEIDLSDRIFPQPVQSKKERSDQEHALRSTDVAQPALGAINIAMHRILNRFGITPEAAIGHSYGELCALFASGAMDLSTLFSLSSKRGRVMAETAKAESGDSGSMLAVKTNRWEMEPLLNTTLKGLSLANINSPSQIVLAGPTDKIDSAKAALKQKGFNAIKLPVSAAFHSPMVEKASVHFKEFLGQKTFQPPSFPVIANVSGEQYPKTEDDIRSHLSRQITSSVEFAKSVETLFKMGINTFIEVGPKTVLSKLTAEILKDKGITTLAMDQSAGKRFALIDLAHLLCALSAKGVEVNWDAWEPMDAPPETYKMVIPIAGANYVDPKRQKKTDDQPAAVSPTKVPSPVAASQRSEALNQRIEAAPMQNSSDIGQKKLKNNRQNPDKFVEKSKGSPIGISAQRSHNHLPTLKKQVTMKEQNPLPSPLVDKTLRVVQQGLDAMQSIQMQTAAAHQKFLESQTQASKTLQEMMISTQHLTEQMLGLSPRGYMNAAPQSSYEMTTPREVMAPAPAVPTYHEAEPPAAAPVKEQYVAPSPPPEAAAPEPLEAKRESAPTPASAPKEKADDGKKADIEQSILSIVSELTGYPAEMMTLSMDIEGDLGIDSIKRVEILSTIEEKMPGLPAITPDDMANLKTLGQISNFLSGTTDPTEAKPEPIETKAFEPTPVETPHTVPLGTGSRQVSDTLLNVVSELTGYPTDMIDLSMDIEADLGIDSIKRVEILSVMEERIKGLTPITPDHISEIHTLGDISRILSNGTKADPVSAEEVFSPKKKRLNTKVFEHKTDIDKALHVDHIVDRHVITLIDTPFQKDAMLPFQIGARILVTDDNPTLGKAIVNRLKHLKLHGELTSIRDIKAMDDIENVKGLILCGVKKHAHTFEAVKRFGKVASQHKNDPSYLLASVTTLDGAFGFFGNGVSDPNQGGLSGLVKTAALEWPHVYCKALDVDPSWEEKEQAAEAILNELLFQPKNSPKEIGLSRSRRVVLSLEKSVPGKGSLTLLDGDVVIITGGARGVTAASAIALAGVTKSTLILIGRSALPADEPEWLKGITDASEIKRRIIQNEFTQEPPTPKKVSASYARHMADRDISSTLQTIKSKGADAFYYAADVRDRSAVTSLIHTIQDKHGPIKALIHGAGVLEDRFILDKTKEQFEVVFNTKVNGLKTLLSAIDSHALSHLVLFSSVSGRTGNFGQSDYAAANEVLNKIAQNQAVKNPDCKVVSINWGPWDGGMVNDSVKREFERLNINLIPIEVGAKLMVKEMMQPLKAPVEIILGSFIKSDPPIQPADPFTPDDSSKNNKLNRTHAPNLSISDYPVLSDHVINGKPVVPFALITEWLGQSALHANPGLQLFGMNNIRLLNGIKLADSAHPVELLAGKIRKEEDHFEVDVQIRNGLSGKSHIIHSSATAILGVAIPKSPEKTVSILKNGHNTSMTLEGYYKRVLFHGASLRGITKILNLSPKHISATFKSAPEPNQWMRNPLRNHWIGDPLALDCAFQAVIIWSYENLGAPSLPSFVKSYRQYRTQFPKDQVTGIFSVEMADERKAIGDITFVDGNGKIVAELLGYEAIVDKSLFEAFQRRVIKAA